VAGGVASRGLQPWVAVSQPDVILSVQPTSPGGAVGSRHRVGPSPPRRGRRRPPCGGRCGRATADGRDHPHHSRPSDRTDLHRGRWEPYGVCISYWRNTVSPMGWRSADSTRRKAGQCPGGKGCGSKRRPSGNRMDRPVKTDGDIQPERVLTSHGSSRERRKKGDGKPGPNGWAIGGTERPWLSAHHLAPDRLAQSGADSPKPALSNLPSGPGAALEAGA
jgi:hypothetical protein